MTVASSRTREEAGCLANYFKPSSAFNVLFKTLAI